MVAICSQTSVSDFWLLPSDELMRTLAASSGGLSEVEAARRLRLFGANSVSQVAVPSMAKRALRRLVEPLVAILIAAALLSGMTGDWIGATIIVVMVMLSVALDVIQEHKAERAAAALRRSVAIRVDALRDGKIGEIEASCVVPGDVIMLKAGDLVPADGIILDSSNAHANESILTGEPYPVEKRPGQSHAETVGDAFNALFSGSSIVAGEAKMLVVGTGAATRFGAIAKSLASLQPPTAFERGIHRLGMLILRLTVFLSLFVLLLNLAFHRPAIESFLFAIALAVGLTPELLPMVMTVTLSKGALRMASKKVVVKRLAAIHDLGALDVLCTDKTGTLTEARIALVGNPDITGNDSELVLELAAVNSRLETGVRSSFDEAILAHPNSPSAQTWRKIAEVPFDFERRRVSVLAMASTGPAQLVQKGAPEEVLSLCTTVRLRDGTVHALDENARRRILDLHDFRAREGQRLLAIARRVMDTPKDRLSADDERELEFVGFCAFLDPPKESAMDALARLADAGVMVKVISGDNELVVRHVGTNLGIKDGTSITGVELSKLSESALLARVESIDFFCRVSPDQKTRIVRALRARGHIVGFIGDGINDAPAIRAADVGLSVDGATEVAREAADMILLAPDLRVLADGIEEGRRTFANILKYVRMGTSSNFGNMLSMAIASLWLPFLPLTAIQILLNNLLYDTSEIGIPFDDVEPEQIQKPRTWDMSEIFRYAAIMGPLSSVFDLLTFWMLHAVFAADIVEFRTAWFLESMATQILVIFIIRSVRRGWNGWPHPLLTATSLTALGVAALLALTPLGTPVGFLPMPVRMIAVVAFIVAGYLVAADAVKPWAMSQAIRR